MTSSWWTRPTPVAPTGPDRTDVQWFHQRLPGYRPTPLIELSAGDLPIPCRRILLKHEVDRFGLPSFKPLGASWAVYRILTERVGRDIDKAWGDIDELRQLMTEAEPLTLVTATDGNHGRAVARLASLFGLSAHIFVPADMSTPRVEAILSEGAEVTRCGGDYDDTVLEAARSADRNRLIVSDTSWEGYTQIPNWISEGYSTLFAEAAEQGPSPSVVVVPAGVGALALAAIRAFAGTPTKIVTVEPLGADCVARSLSTGHPVVAPGPHRSTMAGLNCGVVSPLAWQALRDHVSAAVTISDDYAFDAMRWCAQRGIVVGETGAAALGALFGLKELAVHNDDLTRELIEGPILLLATEAATDPDHFTAVVGRPPGQVAVG